MYVLNKTHTLGGGMTKRLKVLISIFVVVAIAAAGLMWFLRGQINASADTLSRGGGSGNYSALVHGHTDDQTKGGYTVSGKVVDSISGKPIENAFVRIFLGDGKGSIPYVSPNNKNGTEKDGLFSFKVDKADSYEIKIDNQSSYSNKKADCKYKTISKTITATKAVSDYGVVKLTPVTQCKLFYFRFRVVDSVSGKALPEIEVLAKDHMTRGGTNKDGKIDLFSEEGNYYSSDYVGRNENFTLSDTSGKYASKDIVLQASSSTKYVDIKMDSVKKYSMTGTVKDSKTQQSIAGIKFAVPDSSTGDNGTSYFFSDKLGKYTLNFYLGATTYPVVVTDPAGNYESTKINIVVTEKGVAGFSGNVSLIPVKKFTITASAGKGGKIYPSGDVQVASGKNQEFTITPDKNYEISSVLLDQKAGTRSSTGTYSLNNVTANHTITATFVSTLPLPKPVVVTGNVTGKVTQAGKPVSGTLVNINSLATKLNAGTVTTSTGTYLTYSGLAAGKYNVSATVRTCKRYWFMSICSNSTKTQPVTVVAGKTVTVPTLAF